jgi:glucose/arabinose dehydrogenase
MRRLIPVVAALAGLGGLSPQSGAATPKVVAKGIPFATNVVFDPAGGMWVTSGAGGANGSDGVWYVPAGGRPRHVVRHLKTALGLRWAGGKLYVSHITSASNGRVTAFTGFDGTRFTKHSVALDGLRVGRHTMDSIVQGPDGRLYVGVGSTFDNHGRPGRVVSFKPGRHTPRLEATGLRNPYGLAFHGADLLVTDNGRDDLGETRPPEELDAFDPTGPVADFGFPRCSGGWGRCFGAIAPIATLPAHASTDGLAVKGDFAYVAQNGSTIRRHAVGNDVQRIDLSTGRRTRIWKSPVEHDPLGAAIGPDGDLYVTLFLSGRVVRLNV